MTSDGISTQDWDRVHELAVDVVNSGEQDKEARNDLLGYLQQLKSKYGALPSILATEAEYTDDPRVAEALFLRAFDLSVTRGDTENLREIALSLANFYMDSRDFTAASQWLEVAAAQLRPGNESDRSEFELIVKLLMQARDQTENPEL